MTEQKYTFDKNTTQEVIRELNKLFSGSPKSKEVWFLCERCKNQIRATEKTLKMMKERHKKQHEKADLIHLEVLKQVNKEKKKIF